MIKIKKIILISVAFAFSTYLLISGFAILNLDKQTDKQKTLVK